MAKTEEQKAADKAAKEAAKAAAPAAPGAAPEAPAKPSKKATAAIVVTAKTGNFVRKFDLATHGEDFAENAKEFAGKFGHIVRDPRIGE